MITDQQVEAALHHQDQCSRALFEFIREQAKATGMDQPGVVAVARIAFIAGWRAALAAAAEVGAPTVQEVWSRCTRWRHVKRGTVYSEMARAELQAAGKPPQEGCILVIYHGDDGKVWAREFSEFEDGRFERLPTPPTEGRADG